MSVGGQNGAKNIPEITKNKLEQYYGTVRPRNFDRSFTSIKIHYFLGWQIL